MFCEVDLLTSRTECSDQDEYDAEGGGRGENDGVRCSIPPVLILDIVLTVFVQAYMMQKETRPTKGTHGRLFRREPLREMAAINSRSC